MIKQLAVLSALVLCGISNVYAEFNPKQETIKAVIPFQPGGGTDTVFRYFQKYANERGLNIVPIYKGGADGLIGMTELSEAKPDGYTIGFGTVTTAAVFKLKHLNHELDYVTVLAGSIMTIVTNSQNKVSTLDELEKVILESDSETFAYGSPSQQGIWEQLFTFTKTKHTPLLIPFKGGGPVVQAVLGNHIDFAIVPYSIVRGYVDSGKLKVIAVASRESWKEFSHVPNLTKRYPKWESDDGFIVTLPQNTTPAAVAFWKAFLLEYMTNSQVKQTFTAEYNEIEPFGPEYARARVNQIVTRYRDKK